MIKNFLKKMRGTEQHSKGRNVTDVPLDLIVPNPYQPRRQYDEKALKGLAQSIKTHGLLQPIIVRKTAKHYEIVSGERRVRAFKLLGKHAIPAIIGKFSDGEMLEAGLLENLQRKDLTPLEEAMGFSSLSQLFNPMTQEEFTQYVGKRMGKDAEEVYGKLMLLTFPPVVREALHREWIDVSQASLLKEIPDEEKQLEAIDKIKNENISEEALKRLVKRYASREKPEESPQVKNEALALTMQLLRNVVQALEHMDIHASLEEDLDEEGNPRVKLTFKT